MHKVKKPLVILCDMDSTINKFQKHIVDYAKEKFPDIEVDPSKQKTFTDVYEIIVSDIDKARKKSIINAIFKEDDFWENIPPIKEAIATLDIIARTYPCTIAFATSPWTSNKNNQTIKIEWLKRNIPFNHSVIFSHDKWTLNGDVIIDDRPETIARCKDAGIYTVMPLQPYNFNQDADVIIDDWSVPKERFKLIHFISKLIK